VSRKTAITGCASSRVIDLDGPAASAAPAVGGRPSGQPG
jgi:hypothetical protein